MKKESKSEKSNLKARRFPTRAIKEVITKAMKKSPRVVDPEAEEWKLVSNDQSHIHDTIVALNHEIMDATAESYELPLMTSHNISHFLVFEDISLKAYSLYEGKKGSPMPTCPLTGVKFCTKAIE